MKRWGLKTVLAAGALTMAFSMTAFAGWEQDAVGYWWDNGDGTYPAGEWAWLDGNQDGTAECYYFDASGYMLAGTTTPDGYTVNEGGAWTENGEVQTMQTGQPAAETGIPSWTVGNLQVKQTGDFANAARVWRRVLRIRKNPTAFESYMYASSLQRSGDYRSAAAAFAAHVKRFPKDLLPLAQYALVSYLAEDYRTASEIAGKIPSPLPETLYIKALSEERLGDYSAALKTLLQYLSVRKFSDEDEKYPISIQTALTADKAKRYDVAAAVLEPMIDADPENADLLNLLGYLYAEAGINLGTAEKLLLNALELEPDNPAILDSVAWMYFRQKRYRDAREYIDRSLAATPKGESADSVILDHAGDIYNALGNRKKALAFWRKALNFYSEELDPLKVLMKIENAEHGTAEP